MPDLLRPEPRPSWRARAHSTVASVSLARVATGAGAVLLLAVTAWWLLRSPAPPVERTLPVARSTTTVGGVTSAPSVPTTAAPVTTAVEVMVQAVGAESAPPGPSPPLDLNQATLEQLEALPGVGPTTAQAIIDYRSRHGPLSSVDDLLEVRGIGPAKLDGFRDLVTVG